MTTKTFYTAEYLYPGSFFPEVGESVLLPNHDTDSVLAHAPSNDRWYGARILESRKRRLVDPETNEEHWRTLDTKTHHHVFVGELLTRNTVELLNNNGDLDTVLWNLDANRYPAVVQTRLGNWQPYSKGDVVVPG